MKKKNALVILGVLVLALLLVVPAGAQVTKLGFDYLEVYCTYTDGNVWTNGDVYHARDSIELGYRIPLSAEDPVQMTELTTIVNLNLNMKTMEGTGFGVFTSAPLGVDGAIEGIWNAQFVGLSPEVWLITPENPGHAVGQGTGELEGWKVVSTFFHIDPTPFAEYCGGPPFAAVYSHVDYLKP